MPHQDGRDVVANQPIPRRAGARASGRHDQSSSWTVKTSAASGHDGTAVRLGGEIHGGLNGSPSRRWPSSAPQTRSTAGRISFATSSRISSISPSESRRKSSITWVSPSALYAESWSTTALRASAVRACRRATDRQRDGLEWPARGVRRRAQAIEARGELRWRLRRGVPAIAERHDTPKGAWAVPADPDRRMRLLDRLWGETHRVQSIKLPRQTWGVGRPQLP